jgi:rhodanese-related sulfurtransferase
VLDVRKKASYLEGRIPGAKSITAHFDREKKTFALEAFGSNKSTPIVIYGHGSDGWSAVHATRSAVAAGYTNVLWLRTGWASWTGQKMPVEQ